VASRLFSQVLVLLAEEHGGVHPVVYGLLPNKSRTFTRGFPYGSWIAIWFEPHSVSCDYEVTLFQTVAEYFPGAQLLYRVFFHIVKNFKRAIETHRLRAQCNGGADFSLQARMIPAALAFVPAEDLVRAFEDLSDTRMTLTSLNLIYIIITINLKKNCPSVVAQKNGCAKLFHSGCRYIILQFPSGVMCLCALCKVQNKIHNRQNVLWFCWQFLYNQIVICFFHVARDDTCFPNKQWRRQEKLSTRSYAGQ